MDADNVEASDTGGHITISASSTVHFAAFLVRPLHGIIIHDKTPYLAGFSGQLGCKSVRLHS